jgi:hypothetical protein
MDSLNKLLPTITKEIYFQFFDFSKTDLEEVVKASSACDRLVLDCGNFKADQEFDFKGPNYKISLLSFYDAGYANKFNHWDEHPERVENIIKGIKRSGLRHSLQMLDVNKCKIGKEEVQKMLDKHGLASITAVEEVGGCLTD